MKREIEKLEIKRYVALGKPELSEKNIKNRLEFSLRYLGEPD